MGTKITKTWNPLKSDRVADALAYGFFGKGKAVKDQAFADQVFKDAKEMNARKKRMKAGSYGSREDMDYSNPDSAVRRQDRIDRFKRRMSGKTLPGD